LPQIIPGACEGRQRARADDVDRVGRELAACHLLGELIARRREGLELAAGEVAAVDRHAQEVGARLLEHSGTQDKERRMRIEVAAALR
jgi:hypothetical protein